MKFGNSPCGVPQPGYSGLELEAQLFSTRRKMLHFFSGLNTLSFLFTIILPKPMPDFLPYGFPYVIFLQKGLLKVTSGDFHSDTILKVDTYSPVCTAGLSPSTVWLPKVQRDGAGHEAAASLLCPEMSLLQGYTGHHWKGKRPVLMETISGRKIISSGATATDWVFGDGCVTSLPRFSWAIFFQSDTFLSENETFCK